MAEFPLDVRVTGSEQLRTLANELIGVTTAAQRMARQKISVAGGALDSVVAPLMAASAALKDVNAVARRSFAKGIVPPSVVKATLDNAAKIAESLQSIGASPEIVAKVKELETVFDRSLTSMVDSAAKSGEEIQQSLNNALTVLDKVMNRRGTAGALKPMQSRVRPIAEELQGMAISGDPGLLQLERLNKIKEGLLNVVQGVSARAGEALQPAIAAFQQYMTTVERAGTTSQMAQDQFKPLVTQLRDITSAALKANQPLLNIAQALENLLRPGAQIRPQALQGIILAIEEATSKGSTVSAAGQAALRTTQPLLERTNQLLQQESLRLKEVQKHQVGFATHTGATAQSLLFLQSATQGVMTAMALLRGNILFAGFGLIFMRFGVVRVQLAVMALTIVLGGLIKMYTSLISAAKTFGAEMQKTRFELTSQLGSFKEVGAALRVTDDLARRLGFGWADSLKAMQAFQREGLQPLLNQHDLVADFARTFGLEISEAASLLTQAVGREKGSLESLGSVMGVIPEIFNEGLDDLNEMSRGARAEFVIKLLQRYQGAAEKFARTLPGAMSRVREAFNGFLRDVTEPFARDVLAPAINSLANLINVVAKMVRSFMASKPAMDLWRQFLANLRTAFRILFPDADKFNNVVGKGMVGAMMLALKLMVLISRALIVLAKFVRIAANAFRYFLQLIKPVVDWLRILARFLKDLNLGPLFGQLKDFFVQLAGGLMSLAQPSHIAVLALHGVLLGLDSFIRGLQGRGGSGLGRAVRRLFQPAIDNLKSSADDMVEAIDNGLGRDVVESLDSAVDDMLKGTDGLNREYKASAETILNTIDTNARKLGEAVADSVDEMVPKRVAFFRAAKAFAKFFVEDFGNPIGDMLKMTQLRKIAATTPSELVEVLIKGFTAPPRLAIAPFTTVFRMIRQSLSHSLMALAKGLPAMVKSIFTGWNLFLLISEVFSRGAIEAFVPAKFQGAALLLVDAIFGAISGALVGAAAGAPFAGVGAIPGAIIGAIVGALASMGLDIWLDKRVRAAFLEGLSVLGGYIQEVASSTLGKIAIVLGAAVLNPIVAVLVAAGIGLGSNQQILTGFRKGITDIVGWVQDQFNAMFGGLKLPDLKFQIPIAEILGSLSSLGTPLQKLGENVAGLASSFKILFEGVTGGPVTKALIDLDLALIRIFGDIVGFATGPVMGTMLTMFEKTADVLKAYYTPVLETVADILRVTLRIAIMLVVNWLERLASVLQQSLGPATKIAIAALKSLIVMLDFFVTVFRNVIELIGNLLSGNWAAAWQNAKNLAMAPLNLMVEELKLLVDVISGIVELLAVIVTESFGLLKDNVVDTVRVLVDEVVGYFAGLPGRVIRWVTELVNSVINFFRTLARELVGASIIPEMMNDIVAYFAGLPARILAALGNLVLTLVQRGKDLLTGFYNGITSFWDSSLKPWFGGLLERIRSAIGTAFTISQTLFGIGESILGGLIDGMEDMLPDVKSWLGSLKDKIVGWKGPETADAVLLRNNGRVVMQSLIDGMDSKQSDIASSLRKTATGIEAQKSIFTTAGSNLASVFATAMATGLDMAKSRIATAAAAIADEIARVTIGPEAITKLSVGELLQWITLKAEIAVLISRASDFARRLAQASQDAQAGLAFWLVNQIEAIKAAVGPKLAALNALDAKIQTMALGGRIGLAVVGEQGKELIAAPSGSRVYSNQQTQSILGNMAMRPAMAAAGGDTFEINVHGNVVGSNGMRELAEIITNHQMKRVRHGTRRALSRG